MNAIASVETAPGYYTGLSNDAYHQGAGISKSQLDLIHKSPALFQWAKAAPEDEEKKTALNVGDAVHAILLEPERFQTDYATGPADAPRNTKAGKEKWKAFEAELNGRTVLTAGDQGRFGTRFLRVGPEPVLGEGGGWDPQHKLALG